MHKLSSVLLVGCFLSGCTAIALENPHAPNFVTVLIAPDHQRQDNPAIQVVNIKTASGFQSVDFPWDKTNISAFYVKPGKYVVRAVCKRNWPSPPTDNKTYRLPYGLGTDDSSETFTMTVGSGNRYWLDCIPGLDKSEFRLGEMVSD